MFRFAKIPLSLLGFAIILFTTYAFASSMDAPEQAGQGASMVGGYAVTALEYRLADDPTRVQAIALELDKSASSVSVKVESGSSHFLPCTAVSPTSWDCQLHNVDIEKIDEIQVVALGG